MEYPDEDEMLVAARKELEAVLFHMDDDRWRRAALAIEDMIDVKIAIALELLTDAALEKAKRAEPQPSDPSEHPHIE